MGLNCWILRLSPTQIDALQATPSLVSPLRYRSTRDYYDERRRRDGREGSQGSSPGPDPGRALLDPLAPFDVPIEIDKTWHIFHFLFTGDAYAIDEPGDWLLSGEGIGEDMDQGQGPARLQAPAETREFADFLQLLSPEELFGRIDYPEMKRQDVYALPHWDGGSVEDFESELREFIGGHFHHLKNYVIGTAEKGWGLLIWRD